MILYNKGNQGRAFTDIAQEFYTMLNPTKNNKYTRTSLVSKLEKAANDNNLHVTERAFYQLFLNNNNELLKKTITSTPDNISLIIDSINTFQQTSGLPNFYTGSIDDPKASALGKRVQKIFNYKTFRSSDTCSWLISELSIPVCPYCNQTETFIATHGTKAKLLLDIDHYFPKSIYPYLSLSFYNLIPSCHVCNSHYKGDKIFDLSSHLHPYIDNLHSSTRITIDRPIISPSDSNFNIIFKNRDKKTKVLNLKVDETIKAFGLLERYQNTKSKLMALRELKRSYSETRIAELLNTQVSNHRILSSREEVISYLCRIPLDDDDIRNHVNGKLHRDMSIEFKLYD